MIYRYVLGGLVVACMVLYVTMAKPYALAQWRGDEYQIVAVGWKIGLTIANLFLVSIGVTFIVLIIAGWVEVEVRREFKMELDELKERTQTAENRAVKAAEQRLAKYTYEVQTREKGLEERLQAAREVEINAQSKKHHYEQLIREQNKKIQRIQDKAVMEIDMARAEQERLQRKAKNAVEAYQRIKTKQNN